MKTAEGFLEAAVILSTNCLRLFDLLYRVFVYLTLDVVLCMSGEMLQGLLSPLQVLIGNPRRTLLENALIYLQTPLFTLFGP